jgi:hypothetical protein
VLQLGCCGPWSGSIENIDLRMNSISVSGRKFQFLRRLYAII